MSSTLRIRFTRKKVQQIAKLRSLEFRGAFMAQVLHSPRVVCVGR